MPTLGDLLDTITAAQRKLDAANRGNDLLATLPAAGARIHAADQALARALELLRGYGPIETSHADQLAIHGRLRALAEWKAENT